MRIIQAVAVAATLAALSGEAVALTREQYCRQYSSFAMNAMRQNQHWQCGYAGRRFTDSRRKQFGWCMSVDQGTAQQQEDYVRKQMEACRPTKR